MLIEAIRREHQEAYDRGRLEGRAEARLEAQREGKLEDTLEIAVKMFAKGFDLELIAELTGLANEEILRLQREIENAKNV